MLHNLFSSFPVNINEYLFVYILKLKKRTLTFAGLGVDEDSVSIAAGKEFAIIRTASGKVSYTLAFEELATLVLEPLKVQVKVGSRWKIPN